MKYDNEETYLESVEKRLEFGQSALLWVVGLLIVGSVLYTLNIMSWN